LAASPLRDGRMFFKEVATDILATLRYFADDRLSLSPVTVRYTARMKNGRTASQKYQAPNAADATDSE